MEFIAHRGVVKEGIKENTLEAFKEAIVDSHYVGFECDVRVSKDGVFVIHHDSLIEGALVKNLTYDELRKKGVVRLKEVLRLQTDKLFLIEIKDFDIDLLKLAKMLNKSHKHIYVMSFSNRLIERLSTLHRTFKVGTLNYIMNSEKDYSYNNFICLLYLSITPRLLDYFSSKNIEVILYGIPHHVKMKNYPVKVIVDNSYLKKMHF